MRLQNKTIIISRILSVILGFLAAPSLAQDSSAVASIGTKDQAQNEILIVGSEQDYPPFATGMTSDEAGGFSVELWKAAADEVGLNYTIYVQPFREILQDFKEGRTDVLINLAYSEERDEFADFTVPHVIVHGAVFVRKGESSILAESDLTGKSIIVLNADLAHDYALAQGWGKQLILVDTTAEGFRLLASGKYDALLIGKLPGIQTIQALGLSDIEALNFKVGFSQKFGFAVQHEHSELLARINEGLAIMKDNGTYATLYEKWFGIYEDKEVGLQDVLKYILPITLLFFMFVAFSFYRRQVELRVFEKKLQFITDHAPVFLAHYDQEKCYKFVNLSYAKLYGREPDDLVGKHAQEILGDEGFVKISPFMDDALLGREVEFDTSFPATPNKSGIYSVHYSPEFDETGQVVGFIAAISDVTKRKLAEVELHKLSQALEQAGESVIITDKEGVIEYVNSAFTRITGYLPEEVLGKNPRILKSGHQEDKYYEMLWNTISSGELWHSAIVDKRKDGSNYPALMTISPIFDDAGLITHYVGIQQDMTAHEILEDKLRQAQKMGAMGHLIGGIAHNFNNILAGMTGNLYLAKQKVLNQPDVVKKLDAVTSLSFQAAETIKQLLIFAKKDHVEMKRFGLTSFIRDASRLSESSIPANITFSSDFTDDELIIKGDASQIQAALLNLLNNARDAVEDVPAPKISLVLEGFEADDDFMNAHPGISERLLAHLVVSDNGLGISSANKDRIFEPFFTTKGVGIGTGLGLSMVYGCIQNHHGIIEVESRLGKGTSFHVYLPLEEVLSIALVHEDPEHILEGHGELLLIVDDSAEVRSTSKAVLRSLGYQVIEASDGFDAVEKFTERKSEISLIIMDIIMPRLGGRSAAERIWGIAPEVKIIFATGYDNDETFKDTHSLAENAVVSKPYDIVKLSHMIRDMLDS